MSVPGVLQTEDRSVRRSGSRPSVPALIHVSWALKLRRHLRGWSRNDLFACPGGPHPGAVAVGGGRVSMRSQATCRLAFRLSQHPPWPMSAARGS